MTHDLLQLAEELSDASTRQSNGFYTPDLPSLGFSTAAALRAAHAELTTAREAYLNLGSERDLLQLERDQLRAELEETKALVKRHEAALEILKSPELLEVLADIEHRRWSSWMRHHLANDTEENRKRWFGLMETPYAELLEHSKESDRREVRKTLAAIEAAMKEEK